MTEQEYLGDNMNYEQRMRKAEELKRKREIKIGKDICISKNALVYINGSPVTWDTFTHIYLLDK